MHCHNVYLSNADTPLSRLQRRHRPSCITCTTRFAGVFATIQSKVFRRAKHPCTTDTSKSEVTNPRKQAAKYPPLSNRNVPKSRQVPSCSPKGESTHDGTVPPLHPNTTTTEKPNTPNVTNPPIRYDRPDDETTMPPPHMPKARRHPRTTMRPTRTSPSEDRRRQTIGEGDRTRKTIHSLATRPSRTTRTRRAPLHTQTHRLHHPSNHRSPAPLAQR